MDDQSLRNVLALLRNIAQKNSNMPTVEFIKSIAAVNISDQACLKISSYILEQINQARCVIDNSQLVDEAKGGVKAALDVMNDTFNLNGLMGNISPIHKNIAAYISNFVILLSAAGLDTTASTPPEATELAHEIEEFMAAFDNTDLDPVVRDIAKKHLAVLAMTLRAIPIFGLEASMQAYFELITKLRRADIKTSPEAKSKLGEVIDIVRSWGSRIQDIDKAVNAGANLLERGGKVTGLLDYIK
jgi:hypothetical protein